VFRTSFLFKFCSTTRIIPIESRLGYIEYNYYSDVAYCLPRGDWLLQSQHPYHSDSQYTVIRYNSTQSRATKLNGDAFRGLTKNDVEDNFMYDFEVAPGSHEIDAAPGLSCYCGTIRMP